MPIQVKIDSVAPSNQVDLAQPPFFHTTTNLNIRQFQSKCQNEAECVQIAKSLRENHKRQLNLYELPFVCLEKHAF